MRRPPGDLLSIPKCHGRHCLGTDGGRPTTFADALAVLIVGSGEKAARAAADEAQKRLGPTRLVSTELQGEASEVVRDLIQEGTALRPGETLIFAGEATVTVKGDGRGGRNQELALAGSLLMEGHSNPVLLALGTDGIDGMSPSAGAFADATAVARGPAMGMEASEFLRNNDSHTFLAALKDTVDSGPTGTNVGDLVLLHRRGSV